MRKVKTPFLIYRSMVLAFGLSLMSIPSFADSSAGNPILDPTAMDLSVSPCQDFFQYACGGWLNRTTIPADQSDWGRSFSTIADQNTATLKTVLTDYSQGNFEPATPYAKKLGDYYASCMDEDQIEKDTQAALQYVTHEVDQLTSKAALPAMVAKLQLKGASALFSFMPAADLKDPTLQIAEIDQGGMGLPDSGYYTKSDDQYVKVRQAYEKHIARMFELAGYSSADAIVAAGDVIAVELALATNALPPEELQDPVALYHPIDFAALRATAPNFDWAMYFRALGMRAPKIINLTEAKFLSAMNQLVKDTDLARLRNYFKFHAIEDVASSLGKEVYAEWFDFEGRVLSGQKEPAPRWKRCVRATSGDLSEALGQAYVAKAFSPEARKKAIDLIAHLREAFHQDFESLDWLDTQTRMAALEKLDLLAQKIGYPDKWRNYDALEIDRDSFWRNRMKASLFESRRQVAKIGGQVDVNEWYMSPQTVNAYYDPNANNINFPAAILQPPFFSVDANDASNYGAIGMVIGHEMTHAFDTSGSQFDGHGVAKDWWTPQVKALFDSKAQCLKDQYSRYEALPGLFVNGNLTITENIADQGGLKLAYAAYKLARAGKADEAPIAGLNGDQQFFVAMGQMWCEKYTDARLRQLVTGDPHSPAMFRVIGTVVNNPDFAKAFSCASGTPMAPRNRCDIW